MTASTVRQIYDFLDRTAPFENQESYDNSGFLIGCFENMVRRICLCLDVTVDVIKEAETKCADLIISHHPIIFKPISTVHSDSAVYKLVQSGISYIAAHTNFDVADGGLSDIMLDLLKLPRNGGILTPEGFGRISELDTPVTAEHLAHLCKSAFGCRYIKYVAGKDEIKRIAVCSGAGSDDLVSAISLNCHAFITGDVKHSAFVTAKNTGITLIDAGHFNTEVTFCDAMAGRLKAGFPDIDIFIAENTVDIKYI